MCNFLAVLGFPSDFNPSFKRDISQGDKRTIQNILLWILQRPQDLKRIAYTAKFLVELQIPEEFQMDEEIREVLATYHELQAEFTATHQNVEALRAESMHPQQLQKEITQLEAEKDQLVTKINMFKDKNKDPDFEKLLAATSNLRKEQETEAKHAEKQQEQQNYLEWCDQNLIQTKQRLMEAKKNSAENVSAERLLENLKREVARNRELVNDVLGRELQDKSNRYQKMEMLLSEPATTQNDMEQLTNEVRRLQRECMNLEDKLRSTDPSQDKLAIYKTQASTASKKKEKKLDEMKKLETEKEVCEKMMNEKEQEYIATKGTKYYMKRDDFKDFAMKLREKNKKYKVMKKELEEIRSELNVLSRTEDIIKKRAGDIDDFLKNLERQRGISGYTAVDDKMKNVAIEKKHLDLAKEENLDKLTTLVSDIENQLKDKKAKLAPEIKKLRSYRNQYAELEVQYNEKKKQYENTVMNLETEKSKLNADIDKAWGEYKENETKFHFLNIQEQIYGAIQKKLKEENEYQKKPDARLAEDLKSFNELYITKLKN